MMAQSDLPYLLHRRDDHDTSVESAYAVDAKAWFERILKDAEDFPDGLL